MKIFAIDPGPVQSAWLVLESGTNRIESFGIYKNEDLNSYLPTWANHPDQASLVIEKVASFGMAVGAEVFETVFWSGRFAQSWGREFHRVTRGEVKMHLCQSMRAKDANIRQALIDKLGPQGCKKEPGPTYGVSKDVWAALAVAVTFAETRVKG